MAVGLPAGPFAGELVMGVSFLAVEADISLLGERKGGFLVVFKSGVVVEPSFVDVDGLGEDSELELESLKRSMISVSIDGCGSCFILLRGRAEGFEVLMSWSSFFILRLRLLFIEGIAPK